MNPALDLALRPWIAAWLIVAITLSAFFRGRAVLAGGEVSRVAEPLAIRIPLRLGAQLFAAGLLAWAFDPRLMQWAALPLPAAVRVAALVFVWALLAGQIWVFRSLGRNITDTVTVRREATLVTAGPYRWMRHPLYTFGFAGFAGLGVAAANAALIGAALVAIALIRLRTPIEERLLVERFGDDYRRYMTATPRWLPRAPRKI